jgi:RHS repeat-associated protein
MTIEYGYDPMGRRVRRTVDGVSTYFVMADEDMIAEYEGESMTAKYIHGPGTDEPWALVNRKGAYYYHADGLGSIVAITDGSMRTVQTYEYDFFGNGAFGGLHDMKNRIKQPYAFTGREFDRETRLYYYRARYYDPGTGRFTQQDPIGYDGGLNLYAYVGGNPVNAVDPWGLIRLTYTGVYGLVSQYNYSGVSDNIIICQCWKESSFDTLATGAGTTARGLLQITKGAAQDAGYNYDDLFNASTNIKAGTTYLGIRIRWAGGSLMGGLNGYGTGTGYADNILKCAECLDDACGDPYQCLQLIHP